VRRIIWRSCMESADCPMPGASESISRVGYGVPDARHAASGRGDTVSQRKECCSRRRARHVQPRGMARPRSGTTYPTPRNATAVRRYAVTSRRNEIPFGFLITKAIGHAAPSERHVASIRGNARVAGKSSPASTEPGIAFPGDRRVTFSGRISCESQAVCMLKSEVAFHGPKLFLNSS
jgi:hypothetical protein